MVKKIIFLAALIYLLNYAWPYFNEFFPDAKEQISGFAAGKIISPAIEKIRSFAGESVSNKQIVISFNNSSRE